MVKSSLYIMNDLDSYPNLGVDIKGKWYYAVSSVKY